MAAVNPSGDPGGLDFRLITVHLYWTEDDARYHEAEQLHDWLENYIQGADDEDVLLMGDCNTKPLGSGETGDSDTINNLIALDGFQWISGGTGEFTTPTSEERYDHAFGSPDLMDEYIEGSWDVRREVADTFPNEYAGSISNHCPVVIRHQRCGQRHGNSWGLGYQLGHPTDHHPDRGLLPAQQYVRIR